MLKAMNRLAFTTNNLMATPVAEEETETQTQTDPAHPITPSTLAFLNATPTLRITHCT